MRHFLDLDQIDPAHLDGILDEAIRIKQSRIGQSKASPDAERTLDGRMVALIFEKPSTRTRVSFDVGIRQMSGKSLILSSSELQLGHGEAVSDTGRILGLYVDMIVIRCFEESVLHELASTASVPVINGLTNSSHPCQIMASLMTLREKRGNLEGMRIVWLGDGNNVCNSYIHAARQFKFHFVFCGPKEMEPDPRAVDFARAGGAKIEFIPDPKTAVLGADLIVTDTWMSMHDSETQKALRHRLLRTYQVNDDLMCSAGEQALFTHCLPAHRGEEVTDAVLDGPRSMAFDEAENRLHVQKSIMRYCIEGN